MFKIFYPTEYYDSTYSIDFKEYYKSGYRGVIFDIDNTLVEHDAPADFRASVLIKKLMAMGYKVCFLSNNDEQRVADFNKEFGATYIYKAGKPLAKGYIKAMKKMGTDKDNTLFVGDQLFTDICGANRSRIRSVLVAPMAPEKDTLGVSLKRPLEKIVFRSWKKQQGQRTLQKNS